MNLFLHGIGPDRRRPRSRPSAPTTPCATSPSDHFDVVLTNPPVRQEVAASPSSTRRARPTARPSPTTGPTSGPRPRNKQLNFVQHVKSLLKIHGRAAVVVPDNVLFEGGAGETVRRKLLHECDVHTLLRLPTGIFYAQGVKANVLFFDRKPASETPWTKTVWFYDLRTNKHFTLKTEPPDPRRPRRVRRLLPPRRPPQPRRPPGPRRTPTAAGAPTPTTRSSARDKASLDIFWLRDESLEDSANLPEPHILAAEIADDLRAALEQIEDILGDLEARAATA